MRTITATPVRSLDANGQGRRRWKPFVVAALSLALTLSLLPATVASATPDRTARLSRANPKFTWKSSGSGAPYPYFQVGTMFHCAGAPFTCEYILLHVKNDGKLALTLDATDGVDLSDPTGELCGPCAPVHDIDGYLYRSNAAGKPLGSTLTMDCVTGSSSESCKVAVGRGFYVLEVEYYRAVEASYIGTAKLRALRPARPRPRRR